MKKTQFGFSLVELIILIVIIVLLGAAGWLVYKDNHKNSNTSNISSVKSSSTKVPGNTNTSSNPYAGWNNDCDSLSNLCMYYPTTWSAQAGLGNQGFIVTSPDGESEVSETPSPSNCATSQPGETSQFYVESLNSISATSLSLKIVGGYYNDQLNGTPLYNPSFNLTDTKYVNSYALSVGSTSTFPQAWTCYDYGVVSGEVFAQPVGANVYNKTINDASSWFNTTDAKTSLEIIQSVYTK